MKHPLTRELYDYWNGRRGVVKFVGADIYAPPQPQSAAWRIRAKLDVATAATSDGPSR
jgi:hypothetical protein